MGRRCVANVLLRLLVLGALCITTRAQTVQPAVVQIPTGKAGAVVEGQFDVVNNGLAPMIVTTEAKSFSIDRDGVAVFRRLDPQIHLELGVGSMRLAPKQRRTLYYRVSAPAYPAWFCIYANFLPVSREPGVRVQLEMPHTVYLLDRSKVLPEMVSFTHLSREGSTIRGVMRNRSKSVVRILSLEAAGGQAKRSENGFPLLPDGEREFVLEAPENTTRIEARTAAFRVVQAVQ